jgi:hypothetical protein
MTTANPTAAAPAAPNLAATPAHSTITPEVFRSHLAQLAAQIKGRPLDAALDIWLNTEHGAGSAAFCALSQSCQVGVREGWLANREGGGIKYGRIFKPAEDLADFSVDVVDMADIAGPHHTHPLGEIDLIMPLDGSAQFDGRPAGWCVYGPGTAHRPTVSKGRALVLYLLPKGQIEFTR